jgi:thymidylate kinase
VTGLDGAGKTTLVSQLAKNRGAHTFRLPYHDFVKPGLQCSGGGTPLGDVHTDRLVLAADARLANNLIRRWRLEYPLLISQRGWMDTYIFGAAQGVSYRQTQALLRTGELERATAAVYLTAEPAVAYSRIQADPGADKFETLDFLRRQYAETVRFYQAVQAQEPVLAPFVAMAALFLDTTDLTPFEVVHRVKQFLAAVL